MRAVRINRDGSKTIVERPVSFSDMCKKAAEKPAEHTLYYREKSGGTWYRQMVGSLTEVSTAARELAEKHVNWTFKVVYGSCSLSFLTVSTTKARLLKTIWTRGAKELLPHRFRKVLHNGKMRWEPVTRDQLYLQYKE